MTKGAEYWLFIYNEGQETELLQHFAKFAHDERLNFSWYDAATLSRQVRGDDED